MNTKYILKEVNSRFILTEKNNRYLVTESRDTTKQMIFDSREEAKRIKEKLEAVFPFMIFTIEEVTGDTHER